MLFCLINGAKVGKIFINMLPLGANILSHRMDNPFFDLLKQCFGHQMTENQHSAATDIISFLSSVSDDVLFLLCGYAGTGKTTLISALVKALRQYNHQVILLAPTGRAAKVIAHYAEQPAYTIHKKIYRLKKFGDAESAFGLLDNKHVDTLFVVDEASMISNSSDGNGFGSGRLLDDLIEYIYSGSGCRLLLIGDNAQLPPVGSTLSPALDHSYLRGFGLHLYDATLTEVVRQSNTSGILYNATLLRQTLSQQTTSLFPTIHCNQYADITLVSGNDLIDELSSSYDRHGVEETMVITRSNKRANIFNQGIRNQILWREGPIETGDRLMITKNNYFWGSEIEQLGFIANGEIAQVMRIREDYEIYGLHFITALLLLPDHDLEIEAKIILEALTAEAPGLTRTQSDHLFRSVEEDYIDIPRKGDRYKAIKADPHFNALVVKYAYAITCHKAQGGQWESIFLDIGFLNEDMLGEEFYRWLYTAITRSTSRLYFINLPQEMIEP